MPVLAKILPLLKNKYVIIAIVVVVLLIVVYLKGKNSGNPDDLNQGGDIDRDIRKGVPSYQESWYSTKAEQVFKAMKGTSFSETSNDNIWTTLKALKNQTDWLKLYRAYGKRDISASMMIPQFWIAQKLVSSGKLDLTESLKSEGLLVQAREILTPKGIVI